MEIRPQSTKISYPTEARQRGADIVRETSEERNAPIQKRTKNLMARDVASGHWVIRDKEDLNRYLEQIRERVEAELEEDVVVRIQF